MGFSRREETKARILSRRPNPALKDPGGFIITAIIGIAGSLLATWVGQNVFGWYQAGQSAGFIASVVGAIVLLLLYHLVKRKSA